ncbi:MAG: VWA domain-containing protein [Candidatus Eremiobacteraeota bacterium]|nr:VWA domain-containing protein [Candidatus Eremiobacteraeota bacterium]
MSFDHPVYLIPAVFLAIALCALLLAAQRRMTARDLVYSNVAFLTDAVAPRAWIGRAFNASWIVALALGALAVAGPHVRMPVPARDGSVFICIDTSGSMQSTDVSPTRASAAKNAAAAFIDASPSGTRIGIIAFSSGAAVIAPLSADRTAVKAALDDVPNPNGATAIGDALQLAAQNLPASGHRVVILITDGVNNAGADPQEMASYLGTRHIPIYTIGIGTPNGDIIGGEQSTIDEDALRSYADASGGAYARAENASQLRSALARLGGVTMLQNREVAMSLPFAFSAGGLLLLAMITGFATGRVP